MCITVWILSWWLQEKHCYLFRNLSASFVQVGDSLEKAALQGTDWSSTADEMRKLSL